MVRIGCECRRHGGGSELSVPLVTDGDQVRTLQLYGFSDGGFTKIDEVLCSVFVAAVEGGGVECAPGGCSGAPRSRVCRKR